MESENVNEDNGGINEEIENERERNEIREDIVTTDSSNNEDNDNSEETNDDESDEAQDDIAQLRQWAIQSCIEHCHLDSLLRILRRRLIPNLPITSKTFLRTTSANYEIKKFRSNDGAIIGKLDMWQVVETTIETTCLLQSVACKMVLLKTTIYENDDEENDDAEEIKTFVMPLLHM
ncbi:hypothetical protein RF55_15712 [Lasius niger]|uniref:Uncharacterized protein n=1 Tax=Lasius niger TaxID=67767 RepID=A0A0J7K5K5_LASNI|nr:hypothetical protein RF55_15712 [Lasius niger]